MIDRSQNNLAYGLMLGLISPLAVGALCYLIVVMVERLGWTDTALITDKSWQTMTIISVCINILWVRMYNQAFTVKTLRGIVMATLLMCLLWYLFFYQM